MLFPSQDSMQSFTVRSIDFRHSSNTISDQSSTVQPIEYNHINNFASLIPQQPRRSFLSYQSKAPNYQSPQNSDKPKPSSKHNDNEVSQEMGLIENYLGSHNKFKTYFKSKKYKKIYQELAKQLPLQKSYFSLYMQDKFYALNKHIKISLIHKQTSFQDYLAPYFDAGKKLIKQFYRYFLIDDELYKGTKKVNTDVISTGSYGKSSNVCHFLYLTVTYLYQLAIFYRSKNQRKQAQIYYEANLKIVYKILQSSTSSSSIRRKISQYLISFSSFLIQNRQLLKASKILDIALQNSINLIAILETKLKYCFKDKNQVKQKSITYEKFKKRTYIKLKSAFQLMIAIYLNSAVVFQLQDKEYLSYLALNEVRHIEQILYKKWSIKMKISQVIKKPKQVHDFRHEKTHIVKCYFDMKKIMTKQLQQRQMKFNQNVAIYGLTKVSQTSLIHSKDLIKLFFGDESKKKLRSEKRNMQIIANKIGLIQYDSQCQNQDKIVEPTFQYTINMKSINGSQSSAVYNQIQPAKSQPFEANKLSPEPFVRKDRKKLSKFYNLAMSDKQISIKESSTTKIDPNSYKEFKKSQKTYTTLKSQKINPPPNHNSPAIYQTQTQNKEVDFLDKLINSEVSIKRYLLYGKDFVDKYDLLSKGQTLQTKKDKEKRQQVKKQYVYESRKKIQYLTKNEQQILGMKNDRKKGSSLHNDSSSLLHKKKRINLRQPFNNLSQNQTQKNPPYIVSSQNNKDHQELSPQNYNSKLQNYNRRSSTSLKYQPMSYKEMMGKTSKLQNQLLKKDYIQKNSIYRLKCKSQSISNSKLDLTQISTEYFTKTSTQATSKSTKYDNQSEATFKFQNSDKPKNLLKDLTKGKLTKKTLNSNMFYTSQTGIRLLKKIIFKHKKTLNINKPDLFVNYNKTQIQQEEIKLVQKQSLLMVQYQMCQEQTKARIKENMKQLIVDNIRNSEENQKRVQKLNKAISEYDKNTRVNEFSAKMRHEYDARAHQGTDKFTFTHNPQYFTQTLTQKKQRKNSQTEHNNEIVRKIFERRILQSQNESDKTKVGENQNFLTGNKIRNPNLFLSSIQYKEEDTGYQKQKMVKNMNKAEKERKFLDESELQEMQEGEEKKDAIEKFLALFKNNLSQNRNENKILRSR